MSPEQFEQLYDLFARASELPPQQWAAFAQAHCADPEVKAQLQRLLQATNCAEQTFDRMAADLGQSQVSELEEYWARGTRVGNYEIIGLLGRGGMGSVFLAERCDGQFERSVVIKMVALDTQSQLSQAHFESEIQLLARLQHPNIAQLHDAGVASDGRPYFVMEHVDGEQITDYCRDAGLSLRKTLVLFLQVIDAVQYAHQSLVIHRDLKPGNVLVTEQGDVKLLDFGIASALDPATRRNVGEALAYTPEYAAPEQQARESLTTATDVHLLGQLLFELITGSRPSAAMHEGSRVLDLSNRFAQVPRDLASLLSRASAERPAERYASPSLMGRDIRAWLDRRPVEAHGGALAYRSVKMLQRQPFLTSAAIVLLVGALLTSVVLGIQGERIERERDRARRVTQLLIDTLTGADPERSPGYDPPASELLAIGQNRIAQQLPDQPALKGELYLAIARTWQGLGQYERAAPLLDEVMDIARGQPTGNGDRAVGTNAGTSTRRLLAETLLHRGENLRRLGALDAGEDDLKASLALYQAQGETAGIAAALGRLGRLTSRKGDQAAALPMLEQALALVSEHNGVHSSAYAVALNDLASVYFRNGEHARVRKLLGEARDVRLSLAPDEVIADPAFATWTNNLALAHYLDGDWRQAEPLFREALTLRERIFVRPHPDQAQTLTNLGLLLSETDRSEEAYNLLSRALKIRRDTLGEQHVRVAESRNNLAMLHLGQGEFAPALAMFAATEQPLSDALGAQHPAVATALSNIGTVQLELGDLAQAEQRLTRSLRIREAALPADHLHISYSLLGLGRLVLSRAQAAGDTTPEAAAMLRAGALLERALAIRHNRLPAQHWLVGEAQLALGQWQVARGELDAGAHLLAQAEQSLREARGEGHYLSQRATAAQIALTATRETH